MEKQIFKVGDKVFDIRHGWGEVINVNHVLTYPIIVEYKDIETSYTTDGKIYTWELQPTLSFTEYTLQGFSQERPKPQPKVGELCVFWDNNTIHGRCVIAILESIGIGEYKYLEHGRYWENCITLEEFYKQQNKQSWHDHLLKTKH